MTKFFFALILPIFFSCSTNHDLSSQTSLNTNKPKGLFSSSFGNESALDHNEVNGSLIRVKWSEIEPRKGEYDFSIIDQYLAPIKTRGLQWSLGVIAGSNSPNWLIDSLGIEFFEITGFDKSVKKIPKIWDPKVNDLFKNLAEALAANYADDQDLVLVYVPQMTANGIEGHFNAVSISDLTDAGLTPDRWINSVKETAKLFASAFSEKAIAVEVHDIMDDTTIPNQIITDLWNDSSLNQRVGAAMWWISGKTTYQSNLIEALTNFPGDIYAQAIGRSDQIERFKDDDYTTMFSQARTIGIRYIELWEYEFVNNTYPEEFNSYNTFTDTAFN